MNRRIFLELTGLAATSLAGLAQLGLCSTLSGPAAEGGDDTDRLQAALDTAARRNEPLRLPAGEYRVSRTLRAGGADPRVLGAGAGCTTLIATASLRGPVLAAPDRAVHLADLSIRSAECWSRLGTRGARFAATV